MTKVMGFLFNIVSKTINSVDFCSTLICYFFQGSSRAANYPCLTTVNLKFKLTLAMSSSSFLEATFPDIKCCIYVGMPFFPIYNTFFIFTNKCVSVPVSYY